MTAGERVPLSTVAREWGRIGCVGFGGPPTHIALLRELCVKRRRWLSPGEFEDGIAATNLLPGPASTQLAIYCAWRVGGRLGALVGGASFIVPGLVVILALSAVFLAADPPGWILGAATGAGAAVPAVALAAAVGLLPASWDRAGRSTSGRARWITYLTLGGTAAVAIGPWLVLVLGACGIAEVMAHSTRPGLTSNPSMSPLLLLSGAGIEGIVPLLWVALKVGALSFGGGFVIIPLMQHDAVDSYHWLTGGQFLGAVALGQITPGPVVQTVAVVGYSAAGLGGGILASLVAFAPSFAFILAGAPRFDRLRASSSVQHFLAGAGAAAIGAIAGSAASLGLELMYAWQLVVLAVTAVWLFHLRRGVVSALVGAGLVGVLAAIVGAPVRG